MIAAPNPPDCLHEARKFIEDNYYLEAVIKDKPVYRLHGTGDNELPSNELQVTRPACLSTCVPDDTAPNSLSLTLPHNLNMRAIMLVSLVVK